MRRLLIRERRGQEKDVARTWWRLAPQTELILTDGRRCLLLFAGYPGGPAGPDVRDAVLRLLPGPTAGAGGAPASPPDWTEAVPSGEELRGNVEFHLRASDWFVHGHQHDARYNGVILHVVHYPDEERPARRQDGTLVPACSLLDQPDVQAISPIRSGWPCQSEPLTPLELTSTLLIAGLRRFHEKSARLEEALAHTEPRPDTGWSPYDLCLLGSLAEGLGYGRDRAFFYAAGQRLLGLDARLPEPLGHTAAPAPLDASRLRILRLLLARWQAGGAWQLFRQILLTEQPSQACIAALRSAFQPLSRARSDILLTNLLLPFASAVAHLEGIPELAARASHLYLAYPALPSNALTRLMCSQLRLENEPAQAVLQQGLHDIYQRTCRAKTCQQCVCGHGRRE